MRNGFMTILQTVQNDYGMMWSFALTDSMGMPLDISDSNLIFKAQIGSDYIVQFANPMTIINASQGLCSYTILVTDFPIPGTWQAQIVVTYLTGEVVTFSGVQIIVDDEIPLS